MNRFLFSTVTNCKQLPLKDRQAEKLKTKVNVNGPIPVIYVHLKKIKTIPMTFYPNMYINS